MKQTDATLRITSGEKRNKHKLRKRENSLKGWHSSAPLQVRIVVKMWRVGKPTQHLTVRSEEPM